MAICNPTGSLSVTIKEEIRLPNGNMEANPLILRLLLMLIR